MWDLTVPGNNDHDFYVGTVGSTVLVHNQDCPVISDAAREHVLNGVITDKGDFAGWHLHPDQTGGIPDGRFINGEMITNPDGTVDVSGTVGAIDEDGVPIPKRSIGHTFFPADWTADKIMEAGQDLLLNGTYKRNGALVQGIYDGVRMVGFLEKGEGGSRVLSTFFPEGG